MLKVKILKKNFKTFGRQKLNSVIDITYTV